MAGMDEERGEAAGSQDVEDELAKLDYARPRLCRRYQQGALWKAIVRVVAGMLLLPSVVGYVAMAFAMPVEAWLAVVVCAALVGLAAMITYERGFVLRHDIWGTGKDRKAAQWRASASRYDSSGVTVVDPHSRGSNESAGDT
jgi:hypothetical protein